MDVQFVASVAPIVRDLDAARAFYQDALGLSLEGADRDYRFTHHLEGTKHFGLWPLAEAATACFGTTEWPADVPVPQASIEFEVPDVAAAAKELNSKGYQLIHDARTEPWRQITARLLSPEGLLVAVCYTPSFHGRRILKRICTCPRCAAVDAHVRGTVTNPEDAQLSEVAASPDRH